MTVADYMREALTNPVGGYYMRGGMIGSKGDFVTSPEVSQMFGELVGVWHVAQWSAAGAPPKVRLVELGPGKGTMMVDMLRAIQQFPMFAGVSVHLVEASPALRASQCEALCRKPTPKSKAPAPPPEPPASDVEMSTVAGAPVTWHDDLAGVPSDPDAYTMVVAHEFLDALPIHQFEAAGGKWHERLVGLKDASQNDSAGDNNATAAGEDFCFTRSPARTAALQVAEALGHLPTDPPPEDGRLVEVCLDAVRVCREVGKRLTAGPHGGSALFIDYGDATVTKETLRAFRDHKEVGVIDAPGSADLTSDVNFGHIAKIFAADSGGQPPLHMLGPITQRQFLLSMAIQARAEVLCRNTSPRESNAIKLQVHKLVEDMGTRFKFAAVVTGMPEGSAVPVFQG